MFGEICVLISLCDLTRPFFKSVECFIMNFAFTITLFVSKASTFGERKKKVEHILDHSPFEDVIAWER